MPVMSKSYRATFLKRAKWWVGWSEDVPGALTQGRTLAEARSNLRDAIRLMLEQVDDDLARLISRQLGIPPT